MNRKGFTLVELLAVIVIMAIVLVIAIPSSISGYKKTKLKAEETFVKRLSQVVDSYTTLNITDISFPSIGETKIKKDGENKQVTVYRVNISIQNLIEENIISKSDYINPNNKDKECNVNAEIEIYKDSDFVYCHKIKAKSLDCLTDDYIEYVNDKLIGENSGYVLNDNPYVIDTCVWSDN